MKIKLIPLDFKLLFKHDFSFISMFDKSFDKDFKKEEKVNLLTLQFTQFFFFFCL
jgi:hypothetical protein